MPGENESGYAKAQRLCRKKKRVYDACYTVQVSGGGKKEGGKKEDCDDLFEKYRTCILRVMAKDMEERGVRISEDSMIGEYKEEVTN